MVDPLQYRVLYECFGGKTVANFGGKWPLVVKSCLQKQGKNGEINYNKAPKCISLITYRGYIYYFIYFLISLNMYNTKRHEEYTKMHSHRNGRIKYVIGCWNRR